MTKYIVIGILTVGAAGAILAGLVGLIVGGGDGFLIGAIIGAVLGGLFGIFTGVVTARREEVARRTGLPYETVRRMHNESIKRVFEDAKRGR